MSEPSTSPLRLEWQEARGRLVAHFDPTLAADRIARRFDRARLREAIAAGSWSALYCSDATLDEFARLAEAGEAFSLDIAERRDGRLQVTVAPDAMAAWVSIDPPCGGEPVRREHVARALADLGVVSGILEDEIERALAAGAVERHPVARGRPPVPGTPSRFQSLLPDMATRGPRVDEWGVVNYRELSSLVVVRAGDPLMRRTPATPGQAGEDVKGLVIPASGGVDAPFAATLRGASPSPDDPDLLVADITGQPVRRPDGVDVEPTITMPAVDLGTGNVDFDGTVNVTGDVVNGMRIRASGDVFVGGRVEAAQIEAGGSITIRGGAIGCLDPRGTVQPVKLSAKGAVGLQFCENAVVESEADILVAEYAVHSELTAPNTIVVGKPGARRSQLIGGMARAGAALSVGRLGSQAGVRTQLLVGYHPQVHAELVAVLEALDANEAQQADLRRLIAFASSDEARADRRAAREKAERTLAAAEQARGELEALHEDVQIRLKLAENAHVAIGEAVYPNVEVRLGSLAWKSVDTHGAGTLRLQDDAVVFESGKPAGPAGG